VNKHIQGLTFAALLSVGAAASADHSDIDHSEEQFGSLTFGSTDTIDGADTRALFITFELGDIKDNNFYASALYTTTESQNVDISAASLGLGYSFATDFGFKPRIGVNLNHETVGSGADEIERTEPAFEIGALVPITEELSLVGSYNTFYNVVGLGIGFSW